MGGPRRTVAENVDALEEAITVIRRLWTPGPPVDFTGRWYRLEGARPGPAPAHAIGIWLGAYKRRMLELTGRLADGWVLSTGDADPGDLGPMTRILDDAAERAGPDPAQIRRAYNIPGRFGGSGARFLQGLAAAWAEQLTGLVLEHGISTFILGPGPGAVGDLRRFAEEVAPAVREAVKQPEPPARQARRRPRGRRRPWGLWTGGGGGPGRCGQRGAPSFRVGYAPPPGGRARTRVAGGRPGWGCGGRGQGLRRRPDPARGACAPAAGARPASRGHG
jgi:Luciferase-like monooxygenase